MKRLTRDGENGDEIVLIACNPHANLILEKWKILHHKGIFVQDLDAERQCILCPQMAGQR